MLTFYKSDYTSDLVKVSVDHKRNENRKRFSMDSFPILV